MKNISIIILIGALAALTLSLPAQQPTLANSNDIAGLQTQINGKLPNDGTAATLRTAKVNGYNSEADLPKRLWRLKERIRRESYSAGGAIAGPRVRVAVLGDSTSCNPIALLKGAFGDGGGHAGNVTSAWTKQSASVTSSTDFTKFPGGQYVTINAGTANGTYIEKTDYQLAFQSVFVRYWASSTGGSFKVQYQVNKTGGWVDATGTTDISTGGGSIAGGVVNTNNGGAGRYSQARWTLPTPDFYNIRIQAVTGAGNAPVLISDVTFNAGGWFFDPANSLNYTMVPGAADVDWSLGAHFLSTHFSTTPQSVLTDAMSYVNPHVITFKYWNGATLSDVQTYWNAYASKIRTAAPDAVFVVCGVHTSASQPNRLTGEHVLVDDYLRNWCVNNDSIFVDVRQSFPNYVDNQSSTDDLSSDGLHIYDGNSPNWGGGQSWVETLVWEAIRPAFSQVLLGATRYLSMSSVIPGFPNEIRMNNPMTAEAAQKNSFWFVTNPRKGSLVGIRESGTFYNGGNQTWAGWAGFSKNASDATSHQKNGLNLIADGGSIGAITTRGGSFVQYAEAARAMNGWRFLTTDTDKLSLVAEGKSGQTKPVFAVEINATSAAAGAPLWGWFPSGNIEYEGTTNDAFETTFTYDDPTADATINTPVNAVAGTGTKVRVVGVIPSYANAAGATADSNLATGDVYYAEDTKKVRVK